MGWSCITSSQVITTKPALLHGAVISVTTSGVGIVVYEGQDASSGRRIVHFEGLGNRSVCCHFRPALKCDRGIYVEVEADCDEATVQWDPQE